MIVRHSEQSRGCNAAAEGCEARLSIRSYQSNLAGSFDSAALRLRMTAMNKAVGIIPARWGSTRFPGKPLHLIAGKASFAATYGSGASERKISTR